MVVDVESPAPNQFNFVITNVGRTPADVKSIWTTFILTKRGEKLEIPIDEKTNESLMNTPPCLIPPTVSQTVFRCNIDEMDKRQVFGGNITFSVGLVDLHFYGRIVYSDVLQTADFPGPARKLGGCIGKFRCRARCPFPRSALAPAQQLYIAESKLGHYQPKRGFAQSWAAAFTILLARQTA